MRDAETKSDGETDAEYAADYEAAMNALCATASEFTGLRTAAVLSAMTSFLAAQAIVLRRHPLPTEFIEPLGWEIAQTIGGFLQRAGDN